MERLKVLVVDDSELNRAILSDMLQQEYDVVEARDGAEALGVVSAMGSELSLVLLDIVMPGVDGFGVLESMAESRWLEDIPVVMVSAETSPEQIERAFSMGAMDFVTRPFDAALVNRRVSNIIRLCDRQRRLVGSLAAQVHEAGRANRLMVDILSHIVEFRNGESGLHVRNVRRVTEVLLRELAAREPGYGLDEEHISMIAMASALHDVGKIAIPSEILNKPGKLTDEEMDVMRTHSAEGARMLEELPDHQKVPLVHTAYEICRWHHERWDGRGYPDGLEGDDIPVSAQVVALADVYDALTSPRVYKPAYPHDKAVSMILGGECGAFGSVLLECFRACEGRLREELDRDDSMDSYAEATELTNRILGRDDVHVSDRTLQLFEQERVKHDFFASLSGEIQFEYERWPGRLRLAPFGAGKLGLPEDTPSPDVAAMTAGTMCREDYDRLVQLVRSTSPGRPTVDFDCVLSVGGEERWHRISLMSTWSVDEPPRYTGAIGKAVDIHDARTEADRLRQEASCDALTGLLNHKSARTQAERRLAERPRGKHALMVLDLDNFRDANNKAGGHAFGDKLLRRFADRLRDIVRGGDIVARVGGDEFIVFLEYKDTVDRAVERIFSALAETYEGFPVTTSMGVALSEELGSDYDVLFRAADAAAYWSKSHGRNRYSLYEPGMEASYRSNITPAESDAEGGGPDA